MFRRFRETPLPMAMLLLFVWQLLQHLITVLVLMMLDV